MMLHKFFNWMTSKNVALKQHILIKLLLMRNIFCTFES